MKAWINTHLPHWPIFVLPFATLIVLLVQIAEMSPVAAVAILAFGAAQGLISWKWWAK